MPFLPNCNHDVVISYTYGDDVWGWVRDFALQLKSELNRQLGIEESSATPVDVEVWKNDKLPHYLPERLQEEVSKTSIFVVIMSRSYLLSDWCGREGITFATSLKEKNKHGIFIIEKEQTDRRYWPKPLNDLISIPFYVADDGDQKTFPMKTQDGHGHHWTVQIMRRLCADISRQLCAVKHLSIPEEVELGKSSVNRKRTGQAATDPGSHGARQIDSPPPPAIADPSNQPPLTFRPLSGSNAERAAKQANPSSDAQSSVHLGQVASTEPHMNKTVFISYRRQVSAYVARAIFMELRSKGYDVFMDVESIDSGIFDSVIMNQIAARAHFLIILSPGTVHRFKDPEDLLRKEIEHALDLERNVIPILADGFTFNSDAMDCLQGKLHRLPKYNALNLPHDYFDDAMLKLQKRFLRQTVRGRMHQVPEHEIPIVQAKIEIALRKTSEPSERETNQARESASMDDSGELRGDIKGDQLWLHRTENYKDLWEMTELLPKWPRRPDVTYRDVAELSTHLQQWYFRKGGIFLSSPAQSAYGDLQDCISQILNDQPSGLITNVHYDTIRIKCSALRTELTVDLQSRRR